MPFGFTMPPASAPEPAIARVALTLNSTSDRREFDLHADADPVTIGRASRTRGTQLEAQSNNALFDCPVVSRIHAELRTFATGPNSQQVTITDLQSLHGTKVNGLSLKSGSRFALKTGDVIKLGERVTRGDGPYEGVSITFARLAVPSTSFISSTADLQPTNTIRSFRAPSFSDASDIDSDHAGTSISDGEHHPSSAKTTPEQNKMKLGSQKAPISLDDDDDISSFNEEVTFPDRVPESDVRPAQPTDFDSFSEAGSLHEDRSSDNLFLVEDVISDAESDKDSDDVDRVDEVEYGEDVDDDNLSNSASEMSSEASIVYEQEGVVVAVELEDEEEKKEPAYRELSPELDTFDDVTEATTTSLADIADIDQPRWNPSSVKHYDPVRSSLAVVEETLEPHHQTGRTTTTPFTYGIPGYDAYPATDFPTRSYWDVQHPVYPTAFSQQTKSAYNQGFLDLSRQSMNPQPLFPMSINSIVEPNTEGNDEVKNEANDDTASTSIALEPSSKEVNSELVMDSKRKRDEVDDAADITQPPAKKAAQEIPPPPPRRRLSPKKPRSTIRKAAVSVTRAAVYATIGAVGTVAFLSSPMADSLIQWLG